MDGKRMKETPTGITVNKNTREMTIRWKDEHESIYPFGLLRAACPCATCRGGHEYMSQEPGTEVFDVNLGVSSATTLAKAEPIGQYALSFEWEDGHHFGIYTWHFLRALCPCPLCRGS
jgi:DUF971 family protein